MLFLGENFLAFRDRLSLYADHLRPGSWNLTLMRRAEILLRQYVVGIQLRMHAVVSVACEDKPKVFFRC